MLQILDRFSLSGSVSAGLLRTPGSAAAFPEVRESSQVQRMKKFVNFIGLGVDPEGTFLHRMRRAAKREEFFALCDEFLDHDRPMSLEPYKLGLAETDVLAGEHH